MHQLLAIIPTYNEIENIQLMVEAILKLENKYHILVVDDDSPDGTAKKVKELQQQHPERVFLLERKEKSGLGTAYIAGFNWALQRDYDYIFEIDADFSHNPNHLNRLYETAKQGFDVVVGSRYVQDGKILDWPKDRRFLSYGASLYAQAITGMPVKDPTAGFVCYHRSVLEEIDFENISSIGYSFQIEMKYASWLFGHSIKEVPITFKDRERGTSKMDSSIIKEAAFGVIKMRLHSKKYYRNKSLAELNS